MFSSQGSYQPAPGAVRAVSSSIAIVDPDYCTRTCQTMIATLLFATHHEAGEDFFVSQVARCEVDQSAGDCQSSSGNMKYSAMTEPSRILWRLRTGASCCDDSGRACSIFDERASSPRSCTATQAHVAPAREGLASFCGASVTV
jgi:hypothetical protein